ncbi:polysulfide reductase NrfD [bacterium]|nr:polysulfide reductase NrfD [bacterium]
MAELLQALTRPLIGGDKTPGQVTEDISGLLNNRPGPLWWAGFFLALTLLMVGVIAGVYLIRTGIGTWGLNNTVGWAFDITNFVFWIGIGHAGTLISAVLFLVRQRWRTSVNRAAEAMTIFAVICAGLFPVLHMGRPWMAYWMFPYPNFRGPLWVNFRSPLVWDFFAISTYFIISLTFWYLGMMPDLATLRDRAKNKVKRFLYSIGALGWDGSYKTWLRYETVYTLLAGLATPLVLSVHTIVSWDFATSVIPGWHTTIFPPYFVAGAIFSGMAMVLTLMLVARKTMRLEDYITTRHVDAMSKLLLATGMMVGLAYATEFLTAMYSGNEYEQFVFINRALGPFAWAYWIMVGCNVLVPQFLWFRQVRQNFLAVFVLSLLVNVGMWFERFTIIVTSLHRDYLPSNWSGYTPSLVELGLLIGSFGLFFTLFLLFIRFLPVVSMNEVKGVLHIGRGGHGGHGPGGNGHGGPESVRPTPDPTTKPEEVTA